MMRSHLCAKCLTKAEDPLSRDFHNGFFLLLGLSILVLILG